MSPLRTHFGIEGPGFSLAAEEFNPFAKTAVESKALNNKRFPLEKQSQWFIPV